jgi:hypothetical protein
MKKHTTLFGAAATAMTLAFPSGQLDAATVAPDLDSLANLDRLIHLFEEPAHGNPHIGQVRIAPANGHKAGTAQVYAVSGEDDSKQCIIGSHLQQKSTAYDAAAFDAIAASGRLDVLNNAAAVDIETLTRNGAYAYPSNGNDTDGFFRSNAGFGIENALVFIDGEMIDLSGQIEKSRYTTKATGDVGDKIQAAYLEGKSVTYVYKSDNGHTIVDTFRTDPSVLSTFEKCLETIDSIAVPKNDYITFSSTPFPDATPEIIADIKGSQCLRGVKDEDIAGVRIIQSVTGAVLPFSYSLVMKNGDEVVSDFLKKDAEGKLYVSKSLMQFLEHKVAACAGIVPVATPEFHVFEQQPVVPTLATTFPSPVPLIPTDRTPPTWTNCCGTTNPPPPPAPVPLPPTAVLLLAGIGLLGAAKRRLTSAGGVAPAPTL